MQIRKDILVKGFVQGGSYRKQTRRVAVSLGVTGWVRNRSDGHVEACLEGDESAVDALVAWCAFGPKLSRVTEVLASKGDYTGQFPEFSITDDLAIPAGTSQAS